MPKIIVILPLLFFAVTFAGDVTLTPCLDAPSISSVDVEACKDQKCVAFVGQNYDTSLTLDFKGKPNPKLSLTINGTVPEFNMSRLQVVNLCHHNLCSINGTGSGTTKIEVPSIVSFIAPVHAIIQLQISNPDDPDTILFCGEFKMDICNEADDCFN